MRFLFLLLMSFCFGAFALATPEVTPKLPQLKIDSSQTTVSGLSSGGFMAVQLQIAQSKLFHGAGVFAGGVFGCSEGDLKKAGSCMAKPDTIEVPRFVAAVKDLAVRGLIDSPLNLNGERVFLFQGGADTIVFPAMASKLSEFYSSFMPLSSIRLKLDPHAFHGIPTENEGLECGKPSKNWLLRCGYDGVGEMLGFLYQKLNPPQTPIASNLVAFDQTEFADDSAGMHQTGYLYMPTACRTSSHESPCRLHVALHGCIQNQDFVGDAFRAHAGYNAWAESNRIVVLYPSTRKTEKNPNACWDWWGYTDRDFDTAKGKQIQAIRKMVERLSGA